MVVEFKGKKIEFDEVVDVFDVHGPYCKEVEVLGTDNNGVEYSAMGMEIDDEIDEIDEDTIEVIDTEPTELEYNESEEYLEWLVNNNPDDGSWVGR